MLYQCALHPHPSSVDPIVDSIAVDIRGRGGRTQLDARLVSRPGLVCLPGGKLDPLRLWEHTCVELFAVDSGSGYVEWNFSPTGQVTRFAFSDYRERSRVDVVDSVAVVVERDEAGTRIVIEGELGLDTMSSGAITTVVRNMGGTLAYWALAHPRAEPDFHDAAGFVLSPRDFSR